MSEQTQISIKRKSSLRCLTLVFVANQKRDEYACRAKLIYGTYFIRTLGATTFNNNNSNVNNNNNDNDNDYDDNDNDNECNFASTNLIWITV